MWTTVCVKQGTKREIMKVCNKNQPDGVMTGDPMRLGWLLYPSGVNPVLVLAARLVNTATDGTVTDSTAKANSTRLYPRCLISTIRLDRLFPRI